MTQDAFACIEKNGGDELKAKARRALQQAVDFSFSCQQPNGHWVAPVSADATFTAQYVMFKYAMPGLSLEEDGREIQRWLLNTQRRDDGSWSLAPDLPGNLSTTVEAYLALRLLGTPASDPALQQARDFIIAHGGVVRVRFFTLLFLAQFGLFPWKAIPQMPAELVLMPSWAPLNVFMLSSWARTTLIPILIVRHHEPVYALPNGRSPNNDFLDELWIDPSSKQVSFGPPLWELFCGSDRDIIKLAFTLGDKMLAVLGALKRGPLRQLAIRRCIEWLIEHQEEDGVWAGYFPPQHGAVWALLLEGFPLHHKAVRLGLEALERLTINDENGKWVQSTVSQVWDTALMVRALCEARFDRHDTRLARAADWIRSEEILVRRGDWRIYAPPNLQPGGWGFQYANTRYPDTDDTAVVVMMLVDQDPANIESKCVENGIEWILGMQCRDGSWGAFDINNDARWLHKIPFSDMDSLVDPGTADVTGRILECFGLLLTHRKSGHRLRPRLACRLRTASKKGIAFLLKEQQPSGAWWGRWGSNYNYGTANVLRGLVAFCGKTKDCEVYRAVMRGILWFESCQNDDGGWGETLQSYTEPSLAGCGPSTSAHTAWALESLLRYRSPSDEGVLKGIRWLVTHQNPKTEERRHWSSWPSDMYVGTGFPNVLYLGYPFYHHHFAMGVLARFLDSSSYYPPLNQNTAVVDQQQDRQFLPPHIVATLNRLDVLLMVLGSRGDIDVFLSIAKRLEKQGCRVRIATHPDHRARIDSHGFEFYDAGGSPDEFSKILGREPNILRSIFTGDLGRLRQSLCLTFARFWQAGFDSSVSASPEKPATSRPFIANIVVSSPATIVHVHAAETLQVPLVLISTQPNVPTSEFPHVLTMTKPNFSPGHWWNIASYFCFNLLNWLAIGSFINNLREKKYEMRKMCWVWATRDFIKAKIPQVCLWSPQVLQRPAEWDGKDVVIGGYTTLDRGDAYIPHDSLSAFLETDDPVIAISFGSMYIPEPATLISAVSAAAADIQAKVIICRSWPAKMEDYSMDSPSQHIYLADAIPHGWLLPRVNGFVHHGGAGHTAAGIRAGVPMLVMPFFLDQHFWAAKVHELGLGPPPLEFMGISGSRSANAKQLAQRLGDLVSGRYSFCCNKMATLVRDEGDGADVAARVIKDQLEISLNKSASCVIFSALKADWQHVDSGLYLSGAAAAGLVESGVLGWDDMNAQIGGVDWAAQWRNQIPKSHIHVLCWIMGWLSLVISNLTSVVYALFPRLAKDTNAELPDPVRQARIGRSVYDLELIRRNFNSKEGVIMEERFVQHWKGMAATEFHKRFI